MTPPKDENGTKSQIGIVQVTGRGAFLKLWKPEPISGGDKNYWSLNLILPPNDPQIDKVSKVIRAVATEKWKDKADGILKQCKVGNKLCLLNGDLKAEYDGYAGNIFISMSREESKGRPTVVDRNRAPLQQADGRPYSGCIITCSFEVWAQDNAFGKRMNAELRGVQFVRDGDAFSGGAPVASAEEFADLGDGADAGEVVTADGGESLV